eukprot:4676796-Prymnesium_polylepis.1
MHEPKGVAIVERGRLARVQMVPNTARVSDACYVCRWQRRARGPHTRLGVGWRARKRGRGRCEHPPR